MSAKITPKSADNLLKIDVVCHITTLGGAACFLNVALFKDNEPNAVACGYQIGRATIGAPVNFTHYMSAGTADEITFKVKAGDHNSVTTFFNGYVDSIPRFGGSLASSITITEIKN